MNSSQYWLIVGFLILGGAFSVVGAWKDWDWFMDNRRARRLVNLLGRKGSRVFYAVIGFLLAAGGAVMLLIGPSVLIDPAL
jgi:immunity protein 17 of polymorphic toxin system